jgi:dihydroxyacetone kinase-like protein
MAAAKGRASNQPDKVVGHLDPGAVTMDIQLECLADYLGKKMAFL